MEIIVKSSFTRNWVTKLDDFLNDLAEELAPLREFIAKANKVMDKIFRKLQVRQIYARFVEQLDLE